MTDRANRIEILKQYEYEVEGLDHPVRARIIKTESVDSPYCWEISHHYKPTESAGVYYPSTRCCKSVEEAEFLLETYARSFTNIGVVESDRF